MNLESVLIDMFFALEANDLETYVRLRIEVMQEIAQRELQDVEPPTLH